MSNFRIADGCHLFAGSDGAWRVSMPNDRFIRLGGPADVLAQVQEHLHGTGEDRSMVPKPAAEAITEFVRRGLACENLSEFPGQSRTVHIDGTGPVAGEVARLLEAGTGASPRRTDGTARVNEILAEVDVLVVCADWLPDARFTEIDDACASAGVPWHMTYTDGTSLAIGPFAIPGQTAGYRDTRGRRLAASRLSEDLRALWEYLDSATSAVPSPRVSLPAAAIAAGFIVADVMAYLDGKPAPSDGRQLLLDPASATLSSHPVLRLPEVLRTSETTTP